MQLDFGDDEGFKVLPVAMMTKMTWPLLGNSGLSLTRLQVWRRDRVAIELCSYAEDRTQLQALTALEDSKVSAHHLLSPDVDVP